MEPAVEPKDYIGLELEKEEPVVTDEDLEARMQEIRQMFATMEEVKEDRGMSGKGILSPSISRAHLPASSSRS